MQKLHKNMEIFGLSWPEKKKSHITSYVLWFYSFFFGGGGGEVFLFLFVSDYGNEYCTKEKN